MAGSAMCILLAIEERQLEVANVFKWIIKEMIMHRCVMHAMDAVHHSMTEHVCGQYVHTYIHTICLHGHSTW